MGFVAAGLAVAGIGSIMGASGAKKNAKAQKKAAEKAARERQLLYERQSSKLNETIKEKEDKLYDLGNIFDRFESTGAFGDTNTLENIRTAQEDFSRLAAGDFTGFESQLRKSMSDALVGTVQSGAPIGTYAELAADSQMNFRLQGIQSAVGISEFLDSQSKSLLGLEFGIMDQEFETGYRLDADRVTGVAQENAKAAATAGIGQTALGGAISQIGSSISSFGTYTDKLALARQQNSAMDYFTNPSTPYRSFNSAATPTRMPVSSGGVSADYGLRTDLVPDLPAAYADVNIPIDGSLLPPREGYQDNAYLDMFASNPSWNPLQHAIFAGMNY